MNKQKIEQPKSHLKLFIFLLVILVIIAALAIISYTSEAPTANPSSTNPPQVFTIVNGTAIPGNQSSGDFFSGSGPFGISWTFFIFTIVITYLIWKNFFKHSFNDLGV
jgi:hypothetical protein